MRLLIQLCNPIIALGFVYELWPWVWRRVRRCAGLLVVLLVALTVGLWPRSQRPDMPAHTPPSIAQKAVLSYTPAIEALTCSGGMILTGGATGDYTCRVVHGTAISSGAATIPETENVFYNNVVFGYAP